MRVHILGLTTQKQWHAWSKSGARSSDIPAAPHNTYKDKGWQGYGHWLGTGVQGVRSGKPSREKVFLAFDDAVSTARSFNLKNQTAWFSWCKSGARQVNDKL